MDDPNALDKERFETVTPINPNNLIHSDASSRILLDFIYREGQHEKVLKGDFILQQGHPSDFFFLVEKGIFRAFRYRYDKDITIGFSFKGDIDTCPHSFFYEEASLDNIVALSEGEIIKVYRNRLFALLKENPGAYTVVNRFLVNYIEILVNRSLVLKACKAQDIYRNLYEKHRTELDRIPLKYIASYLGISHERLSRIRKDLKND